MSDKIALFDLDGTLANYDKKLKEDLGLLAGPNEPPFNHREETEDRHLLNRMRMIKSQKDWWFKLEPIESGFAILNIARHIGFKIHVLTKGPRNTPQAWSEKILWCQKYLGSDVDITITHDKGLVYGRVLVDDYPEYMNSWLKHRPRGLGIMPQNDYNKFYSHPNVIMHNGSSSSLDVIEDKLKEAFNRKI